MRRSIATVSLSGTLNEKLTAVANAGFDGVEIFDQDLLCSLWTPRRIRERCDELGLKIEMLQPFRDLEGMTEAQHAQAMRRFEGKLDIMAELGTDLVLVCASCQPDAIDDDELSAEQLHKAAELAHERGMRIAFEALAWSTQSGTTAARGRSCGWPTTRRWVPVRTPSMCSRVGSTRGPSATSRARRSSSSSSRTRPRWRWTSSSGAGITGCGPVRVRGMSPASWRTASSPGTPARCRWRSSTRSSAVPMPNATRVTPCGPCCTSRTPSPIGEVCRPARSTARRRRHA